MTIRGAVLFVLLSIAMAGCGDDSQAPATPSVARTTDSFSGTVQVGSAAFHSFRVSTTGVTDVTLTSASPPATIVMGVAIGTVDDAGCTRLAGASVNTAAGSTPQLEGLTSVGTLCVQIRDVGNQTAPVSYSLTVLHP